MVDDAAKSIASSFAGAVAAIVFLQYPTGKLLAFVFVGTVASFFLGPAVTTLFGANPQAVGFLVGLFAVAISIRVFDVIATFNVKSVVEKLLAKVGL